MVENVVRNIKPMTLKVKTVIRASCTPLTVVEVIQKILRAPGLSSARHEMADRALSVNQQTHKRCGIILSYV